MLVQLFSEEDSGPKRAGRVWLFVMCLYLLVVSLCKLFTGTENASQFLSMTFGVSLLGIGLALPPIGRNGWVNNTLVIVGAAGMVIFLITIFAPLF